MIDLVASFERAAAALNNPRNDQRARATLALAFAAMERARLDRAGLLLGRSLGGDE